MATGFESRGGRCWAKLRLGLSVRPHPWVQDVFHLHIRRIENPHPPGRDRAGGPAGGVRPTQAPSQAERNNWQEGCSTAAAARLLGWWCSIVRWKCFTIPSWSVNFVACGGRRRRTNAGARGGVSASFLPPPRALSRWQDRGAPPPASCRRSEDPGTSRARTRSAPPGPRSTWGSPPLGTAAAVRRADGPRAGNAAANDRSTRGAGCVRACAGRAGRGGRRAGGSPGGARPHGGPVDGLADLLHEGSVELFHRERGGGGLLRGGDADGLGLGGGGRVRGGGGRVRLRLPDEGWGG